MAIDLRDQTFGVEIETVGMQREQACRLVAAMFGTSNVLTCFHKNSFHGIEKFEQKPEMTKNVCMKYPTKSGIWRS